MYVKSVPRNAPVGGFRNPHIFHGAFSVLLYPEYLSKISSKAFALWTKISSTFALVQRSEISSTFALVKKEIM